MTRYLLLKPLSVHFIDQTRVPKGLRDLGMGRHELPADSWLCSPKTWRKNPQHAGTGMVGDARVIFGKAELKGILAEETAIKE